MEINEILAGITECCREVFDDKTLVITESTVAKDVKDWHSLTHIELIVAVEKRFKIRFTSSEITRFKSVGEMCASVKAKLG